MENTEWKKPSIANVKQGVTAGVVLAFATMNRATNRVDAPIASIR